jgi:uncharacterized protein (TIGR04141 family)
MLRKPKPRKPRVRKRHLTLFLLRENVKKIDDALDPKKTDGVQVRDLPSIDGKLYIGRFNAKEPKWFPFVRNSVEGNLPPLKNSTVSGVLFFKAKGRLFAATFGFGRYLLKPDCYELDFGLKATLNTVDPDRLRSLDIRTFEEATVHTRRQTSRNSSLDAFSVDVQRDVLGAVTGEPTEAKYGKKLAGRDALAVDVQMEVDGLPEYGARMIEAFQSDEYKERFDWVDHIRAVRDPEKLKALDEKLVEAINERDLGKMHLAPPEMLPSEEFPEFRYPGELGTDDEPPHSDLDIEECLRAIAKMQDVEEKDLKLNVDDLKRLRIRQVLSDQDGDFERWPLYDCIAFEVEGDDAQYVLSAGDWFRVEKNYAADIRQRAKKYAKGAYLPEAKGNEVEDDYNKRAAAEIGAALIDKKLAQPAGAKSGIEPCDLFTKDQEFVHVKRKTRSSKLSHLFSQGFVSAEAFLRDEKFRADFRNAVKKAASKLATSITAERPETGKFAVVYAIITRKPKGGSIVEALPFFSQVNFVRAAEMLSNFGYRVVLTYIAEEDGE